MRPRDLQALLTAAFMLREPVLVTGSPGIGKTELIKAAAAQAGHEVMISHPVVADPTDAKGLPWPAADGKSAHFLPFGDLARAIEATEPLLWFLDDLGQASPAVQASYMQLLLARRINGHKLPDCVTFAAATNRRTDRAGMSGILEPVKSRFGTIVEQEAHVGDWLEMFALPTSQPAEVISFIRFRPNLLNDFKPTQDLTNSPCPRTWEKAGKWITAGLSPDVELAALTGAVGEGAAAEFSGFLRTYRDLPDLDGILLTPDTAPIPEQGNPSALYAVSTGLATKANLQTFAAIARYAERMEKKGLAEFAILMHRDSVRRCPDVQHTAAFTKLLVGPLGKLIAGDV